MRSRWVGYLFLQLLCSCLIAEENVIGSNMEKIVEQEMQRESVSRPEIKLIGICVRTSNEQELDKMKGKIFPCIQKYFHGALFEKIPNRKKPGTTFCAYTDYESDYADFIEYP